MVIGIDIDDTLTFLHDIKIKTAQNYISKHNLNFNLISTDSHLFSEMFDWPADVCDRFWFEEADKMLSEVQPRVFAKEVIKKLNEKGHKIIIVTARTKELHKDPYQLSYNWLKKNDINFDELLVGYLDKTQICIDKEIDLFIDDMPGTLKKLQEHGIQTIMIENPHNKNQSIYKGTVVKDWQDIEYILNNLGHN